MLVAASWERFPRARRALPLVAAALAAALLANGLAVLDRAYTELGAGLERGRRDEAGRLLPLLRETGLQVRGG